MAEHDGGAAALDALAQPEQRREGQRRRPDSVNVADAGLSGNLNRADTGDPICANGWHVCSGADINAGRNDATHHTAVKLADALAFPGCYAYNANNDCHQCSDQCQERADTSCAGCHANDRGAGCVVTGASDPDMVGIGGDCRWEDTDYHNTPACISDGRIRMQGSMHSGCTFTAGVNPTAGLVCCRDDFQQADGALSGVLGYYSFNDSTATDKSGNGRDGTWERGTEQYSDGVFGTKGALFDGASRVTVDAFQNYDWGQDVAVSVWFKRTSAEGYQSIVSNGYYNTGSWEIRMGREGGGSMLGGGFITDAHGLASPWMGRAVVRTHLVVCH